MLHTFLLIFLILYLFPYFLFFHCEAEGYLNALRFQDGIKPNNKTNSVLLRECSSSLLPGQKKLFRPMVASVIMLDTSNMCRLTPRKNKIQRRTEKRGTGLLKKVWLTTFWMLLLRSGYIFTHCCIMDIRCDSMFWSNSTFCDSFSISRFLDIFLLGLHLMFRIAAWPTEQLQ